MRFATFLAPLAITLLAVPASATIMLKVTKGGYFNNAHVSVTGPGPGNGTQIAANFRLQGTWGGARSGTFDLIAFCVDLAHTIPLGNNVLANLSPPLNYQVGTLAMAPGGGALSPTQIKQMEGLAALGIKLVRTGAPNLSIEIPAIQSAIWSIEYGKTITSSNPAVQARILHYIATAPSLTGRASYIFSTDKTVRQGLFTSPIPEPGTWAMLILGFGLVGAAFRRRQHRPVPVAA